jgi:hypothetical protein
MLVGLLVLGLTGGLLASLAAASVGAPLWLVALALVVVGNLSIVVAAFVRLSLAGPSTLHDDVPWGAGRELGMRGPGQPAG